MALKSIESSIHKIIAHGSAITFGSEPIIVTFDYTEVPLNTDILEVEFQFLEDTTQSNHISWGGEGKRIKITIYNAASIGGTKDPILVATNDTTGKSTFINVHFQKIGASCSLVFTLYTEI